LFAAGDVVCALALGVIETTKHMNRRYCGLAI
jgi:hypothetical protein